MELIYKLMIAETLGWGDKILRIVDLVTDMPLEKLDEDSSPYTVGSWDSLQGMSSRSGTVGRIQFHLSILRDY